MSAEKPVDIDLKLRVPYWAKSGSVKVNGRPIPAFADPGSYLVLRGPWKNGDRIELSLPMHLHAAPMPDKESLQAAMYGPLVLAARFEEEPREKWYRHFAAEEKQEPSANAAIQWQARRPGKLARTRGREARIPRSFTKSSRGVCAFVEHCA